MPLTAYAEPGANVRSRNISDGECEVFKRARREDPRAKIAYVAG